MTYLQRLADHFQANPGTWISCYELERICGHNGWRTRVSECRVVLGMNISSPPKKVKAANGVITTYYRYQPASLLELCEAGR